MKRFKRPQPILPTGRQLCEHLNLLGGSQEYKLTLQEFTHYHSKATTTDSNSMKLESKYLDDFHRGKKGSGRIPPVENRQASYGRVLDGWQRRERTCQLPGAHQLPD